MPPRRTHKKTDEDVLDVHKDFGILSNVKVVLITLFAPLALVYLNLRCEKSFCILWQLPLVVPAYTTAYFSGTALCLIIGFIFINFCWSVAYRHLLKGVANENDGGQRDSSRNATGGIVSLVFFVALLLGLIAFWPEAINTIHIEHLRLLTTVWCLCLGISVLQMLFVVGEKILHKENTPDVPMLSAFYYGLNGMNYLANIEIKHFFYVNIGLVGWAVLDLLVLLNNFQNDVSKSTIFVVVTHLMYIGHTVYFENLLLDKPYMQRENIGYNWLQKVVIFLPFLSSLVASSAAVPGNEISTAVLLCNVVLFVFGFVIYLGSLHFLQLFVKDPKSAVNMESIPGRVTGRPSKRFLVGGYYSFVHKPDLLGLGIMWISWAIAGGINAVCLIVLLVWLGTLLKWAKDSDDYNAARYPEGWANYNEDVPKKIVPLVY